jgi:ABC-type amino acid transport substrate-binding protein
MQGAAIKLAFANNRALALLLLLVFVLTPACPSFCQAQACQESNATKQESGCHHEEQLTTDHSSKISAKAAKCGSRDILFALRESAGEWRAGERTSASFDPDCSSPSNSADAAFPSRGVSESNTGQLSGFHIPVASQISAASLVVLRI